MIEVHYKLKPLLTELENYRFTNFLASNAYDRELIISQYGDTWNNSKKIVKSVYQGIYKSDSDISFETFWRIVSSAYSEFTTDESSFFSKFLTFTLVTFFQHTDIDSKYLKIFEDLNYLPISQASKLRIELHMAIALREPMILN